MSRLGLTGAGRLGPIYLFRENKQIDKMLGSVLPDFAMIKPTKIMYLIVLMQLKSSFLFGKFCLLTAVNFHTSKLIMSTRG